MKKKIGNTDMPIGRITRISDFLPQPVELVIPEEFGG